MSALEDVYRQAVAVHAELKELKDPGAMLIEVQDIVYRRQDG